MRYGLTVSNSGDVSDARLLAEIARAAEAAGWTLPSAARCSTKRSSYTLTSGPESRCGMTGGAITFVAISARAVGRESNAAVAAAAPDTTHTDLGNWDVAT
ncbi:MAG: hypothetical protein JO318_17035 [Chloroflexi bacterium]|nr:hypothetical protein [Chloroflexota bacterium]